MPVINHLQINDGHTWMGGCGWEACSDVCEETEGFLMKAASCVAWLEWRGSMSSVDLEQHLQVHYWTFGHITVYAFLVSIWSGAAQTQISFSLCISHTDQKCNNWCSGGMRTSGWQLVGTFLVNSEGANMDLHTTKKEKILLLVQLTFNQN